MGSLYFVDHPIKERERGVKEELATTDLDEAGEVTALLLMLWRVVVAVQSVGFAVLVQAVEVRVQCLVAFLNSALDRLSHNDILSRIFERESIVVDPSCQCVNRVHLRGYVFGMPYCP